MASTSNQTTPRSNVFLNFRGEDTRRNFIDHLCKALHRAGIQTFMDDPDLPRGEEISSGLLKAIQGSKISIVVFSKNYASSTWCLEELVKILECRKTMGQLVLPVFYNVNPSDLRYQRGSFAEAFEKHEIHFVDNMDKVKKWRDTLTEAADLSGFPLDENGYEADLIEEIVAKVRLEVNPIYLNVAMEPVGIDSRVKDIIPLLSIGTNGVRRIGICGMGGVGKTTIAKAVYNEIFNRFSGSCFLANIREASGQSNGLVRVQEQLISEVLKMTKIPIGTVDRGISLIQERLHSKVLIVLDDLDHLNQFNSLAGRWNRFASGSVIIITTRDGCLLDQIQVEDRYMLKELDNNESLELFSRHAFGKTKPLDDFMELSKEVVSYAGGLPLALKVFGSNLIDQTMIDWTSFIEKLQHIPNNEIQEQLIISFDALDDDNVKDIFLDIACFFIGMYKDDAVTVLGSCYYSLENEINNLIKRCLLTINDKNELRMHDLIRDMGRKIVRSKFPKEPGKRSRLWSCEDICNVLKKHKGTEEIEGIIPDDCDAFNKVLGEVPLNTETFKKMHRLRFLSMGGVHLTGSFEHIFEELRWLSWRRCPLEHFPSDFHPEKLVFLDLQLSKLKILWDGILPLEQLKILNLESCELLTTTPDFTGAPYLENLILTRCTSLVVVHPSIGCLSRLVYLNLSLCKKLRILPSSICNLRAMKSLHLDDCSSLEELPEDLGNIESLHELFAVNTDIRKLPDSIGRLTKLVELDFSGCYHLTTLPSSICDLRLLESLVLDGCDNLEELPAEMGNIESLRKFYAKGTSISKLPHSIGCLSKLVELDLGYCEMLRYLPHSICNLRALQQLDLWGCSNLKWLPKDLGNIKSLKKLRAGETNISKIPHSIGDLKKLEILSLDHASPSSSAKFVPHSVPGLCTLKTLDIGWCRLVDRDIPYNIGSLSSLQSLRLCGNYFYSLPSSLTQLSSLKLLDLTRCQNLLSLSGLPPNLQVLYAGKCTSMQNLPNLSNLIHLEELYLADCSKLASIHGLEKCISITKINMGGCFNLANTFTRQSFFQACCGFGHEIEIILPTREIPDWFSHLRTFDVPNSSLFGGIILWAVRSDGRFDIEAVIDNKTSGIKWTCQNWRSTSQVHSWVRIIPETKFSLNNGDRIEVSFRGGGEYDSILSGGVHPVYRPETADFDGRDHYVEEISYPSKRLKL